ncbi:MAG TPA: ATP-binding protein [Gaiellaceae bacterium]|nr:ATP-binding protein [Gaiellaceae bacterium]
MSRPSLRDVRTRLLVVVLVALAVGLAAATAGFNLLVTHTADRDANAILRQRVDSERSLVQIRNGALHLTEHSDDRVADARIWIFQGGSPLEAPRSRPEATAATHALTRGPSRFVTLGASDERLLSLPITQHGRRYGTIVAGVSLAPYEHTARIGLIASVAFAITLLLVVAVAVWWLLRSTLDPVARMTVQASRWSETDLEGRFRLGEPHDELTRLAWTLDQLLDRIAASLRHERLVSAELSHELRTPLAKLRAEAELALRRRRTPEEYTAALKQVLAAADQLERIVHTLLAAARQEAGGQHGVADAHEVAVAAVEACAPIAEARGVKITVDKTPRLNVGVDAAFAERVIHPVLDNACRYAHAAVRLEMSRSDGTVAFSITDDGPGVPKEERSRIFDPATRGAVGRTAGAGAGLGLALARRLARAAAGDVEAAPTDSGARFVVRLPAA